MYNLFYAANNENNAQYGYVLMKDKIVVKEIYFDKEKMAYADIVRQKINFLTEILNDFPEINWKRMLITIVAQDDDIVEFYKQVIVAILKIEQKHLVRKLHLMKNYIWMFV